LLACKKAIFLLFLITVIKKNAQETINLRVKRVRVALNMTQVNFSRVLSLSSGYLAGVETGKRKVNDRIVKLTCSSFGVSEQWLRSGEGGMFAEKADPLFAKLAGLFKELSPQYQQYIFKQIDLLLEMQSKDGAGKKT
jgi:transcriptional regulator with XRE-family HTH domain